MTRCGRYERDDKPATIGPAPSLERRRNILTGGRGVFLGRPIVIFHRDAHILAPENIYFRPLVARAPGIPCLLVVFPMNSRDTLA